MAEQVSCSRDGLYGYGIYSDHYGQISMAHATPDAAGNRHIFVCCTIEGDRVRTNRNQVFITDSKAHSGGDAENGWITRTLNDDWVRIPLFVVERERELTHIHRSCPGTSSS
jgi:hypothetical protein